MPNHHINKIMKLYTETKVKGRMVEYNTNVVDIVRDAEQYRELYRYNETTYFCCYKTSFNSQPAIMMLFTMNLPGPISGSSAASEYIMSIMSMIEHQFTPLEDSYFTKELDSSRKNIGFLRIIKVLREDDIL